MILVSEAKGSIEYLAIGIRGLSIQLQSLTFYPLTPVREVLLIYAAHAGVIQIKTINQGKWTTRISGTPRKLIQNDRFDIIIFIKIL